MSFTSKWVGKALKKGRLVAAIGGAFEVEDGVWFGFLELPSHLRKPSVFRHVISVLRSAKEQGAIVLKATCDTSTPRAEEMMRKIGFEPTDETISDKKVWVCLASKL